jgi:hypothetical protein
MIRWVSSRSLRIILFSFSLSRKTINCFVGISLRTEEIVKEVIKEMIVGWGFYSTNSSNTDSYVVSRVPFVFGIVNDRCILPPAVNPLEKNYRIVQRLIRCLAYCLGISIVAESKFQ